MIIRAVAIVLAMCSACFAGPGMGPGPGIGPYLPVYDYCVRADGTATKSTGTDCLNASTSMSVNTFNASTFLPGEIIYFSSRGGNLTRSPIMPSSGTSGNLITYSGEPGHIPVITSYGSTAAPSQNGKSYIDIRDMVVNPGYISGFEFSGSGVGVQTHNLDLRNASNQCIQHTDTVQVDHYNLTTSGASDDGLSMHDGPTVRVFGGSISGYNGINWVGTGTLELYDVTVKSEASSGYALQPSASSYNFTAHRTHFIETPGSTKRAIDFNASGSVEFFNCSFRNLGSTDYYMLLRSALTSAKLLNSVFYSGSITGAVVFNQQTTGLCKNNAFHTTTSGSGKAYYQASGVDNTGYYLSGTTYNGTTYTITDPLFVSPSTGDFHIQAGSPLIGQGVDLSAYFTTDIDGHVRVAPWDIGLDEL